MTNETLTYALIEKKIEEYAAGVGDDKPGVVERTAFAVAMVLWMLLVLAAAFVKSPAALSGVGVLAGIAVAAIAIGFILFVRREWRMFYRRNEKVSRELDGDYDQWRDLVASMSCFPRADLQRRLRYLAARKSSLAYRMGLFTGSIQRLGVLPLLAILYLQFKDWRFGDWQALGQVHLVGGLLLWMLFLAYLLSWWLVGLGTRWDAYEALLIEATHDE